MTTQLLQALIDKTDAWEGLSAHVAQLLADEIANQRALAQAASKPSGDWALRIYREIESPIELFREPTDPPVCNVRFARADYTAGESTINQQVGPAILVLELGAAGQSAATVAGHTPGDQDAANRLYRAAKLVRNILMAGPNQYLQIRKIVGSRQVTEFQRLERPLKEVVRPELDFVALGSMTLEVKLREYSPEYTADDLEKIAVDLKQGEDGRVLAQMEFDK